MGNRALSNTRADELAVELARARFRVVVVVLSFALGLILGRECLLRGMLAPAWVWLSGALACVCVALVVRHASVVRTLLAVGLTLFGAGWLTARCASPNRDSLTRVLHTHTSRSESLATIEGLVTSDPRGSSESTGVLGRFAFREPARVFTIRVRRVLVEDQWRAASGMLYVRVAGSTPLDARTGSSIRATGRWTPVQSPANPGDEDRLLHANQESREGVLRLSDASLILPAAPATADRLLAPVLRARAWLRARAELVLARACGEDMRRRALIEGLLLGLTERAGDDVIAPFTRLGLLHILSISGFHLTVMTAAALWMLRLTGDRGMFEPLLLAMLVLAYVSIVPATTPVVRSACMVIAWLGVEATGRRYDRVCMLGWIALLLLLWKPLDLWNLGFQLSVGLTAMLLWAGDAFTGALFTRPLRGLVPTRHSLANRIGGALEKPIAASLMCWIVSMPTLLHTTGRLSLIAVPATIIVSPIVVIMLWVGFGALLLGVIVPGAGAACGFLLRWLADIALVVTGWLDALPLSSWIAPATPLWWAIPATVLAVAWARLASVARAWWFWAWSIAIATLALVWILGPTLGRGVVLRVDMLSVGDGTCMIVRTPHDALLFDAKHAGRRGVVPMIAASARALGTPRIGRAVISHPDLDHFGGLPDIVEPLGLREVIVGTRFMKVAENEPRGATASLREWCTSKGIGMATVSAGDDIPFRGARVTVLSPPPDAQWAHDNDHSLVLLIEAPTGASPARLLLTGDVQHDALRHLMELELPEVDAVEAPHHGSFNERAAQWLIRLAPRVVLQSTGPRRAADDRWSHHRSIQTWLTTSERGWCFVEWLDDGTMRTGSMR